MIDIHTHILPRVDDGAEDWPEALEMAQKHQGEGTGTVVATPHFIRGSAEIEKDEVLKSVREINRVLKEQEIDLQVLPGMEVEICPELVRLVKEKKVLTINDGGKYLLVELPFFSMPPFTAQVFYELMLFGVTPILAHPERNQIICQDTDQIHRLIDRGVKIQVNAGSFLGHFGGKVKKTALFFLRNGLIHLIGTDAHRAEGERGPCLQLARTVVEKTVGKTPAQHLFEKNPLAVIEGRGLVPVELEEQKSGWRSFWQGFR
ncbi:MAG: capsular biosynthesis protein [Clostridia bacterium]|nr:capsular biosynthesis protein [Clostridia bacterium]